MGNHNPLRSNMESPSAETSLRLESAPTRGPPESPAFIIIDDKGNDFFQELNLG